ncbi:hypothetical protein [Glycomyces sp. NPDC021274]|uniref:hypothetical protein n=1 Tax=Glycomyces sp. NPDC021274 TaxID=3155120 RepID=UPI0033E4C230
MPDLLKSRELKARKTHLCGVCGAPAAEPGQTYTRNTFVDAGTVFDDVQCEPCSSLICDIDATTGWCAYLDDGLPKELIIEWAEENANDATYGEAARAFLNRAGLGEGDGQ